MLKSVKLPALLSPVYSKALLYWRTAGLSRGQQLWLGFILVAGIGLFVFAMPQLSLFSGLVLGALPVLLAWAAWSWRAMQLGVVTLAILSALIILSGQAGQLVVYLNPATAALLLAGFLLVVLVESGRQQLTYEHVSLVYWSVFISTLLMIVLFWTQRRNIGLHYAGLPLANGRDVLLLIVAVMVFLYLFFLRTHTRIQGTFIALLPATLTGLYVCARVLSKDAAAEGLPDAVLEHGLLLVHVPAMLIAFALLMHNAGFALLRLFSDAAWLKARQNRDIVETIQIGLEDYLYRLLALAIILLGVGLLTGMWWSSLAWGHYWRWEPKLVMTMAVWLYYLAGLHLRLRKGMQARAFAWWCVAGLPLLVATLIGTNLLPQGLHHFTGP